MFINLQTYCYYQTAQSCLHNRIYKLVKLGAGLVWLLKNSAKQGIKTDWKNRGPQWLNSYTQCAYSCQCKKRWDLCAKYWAYCSLQVFQGEHVPIWLVHTEWKTNKYFFIGVGQPKQSALLCSVVQSSWHVRWGKMSCASWLHNTCCNSGLRAQTFCAVETVLKQWPSYQPWLTNNNSPARPTELLLQL